MKHRVFGGVLFLLGLLTALSPRYILPVCEFTGKQRMACTHTANAELFVGLMVMAIALGVFFSKSPDALRWLMFSALAGGISIIAVPEVLGYCPNLQMPCRYGAVPMLRTLGAMTVVVSLAGLFSARKSK